jgi:hypothetical protein
MNRAIPLMVLATLVFAGCATQPPVSVSRDPDVGLAKGEKLAIVLASHEKCEDGASCEREPTASAERTFAACLTDGIDGSAVLRAATIRDSAFPKMDFEATPRTMPQWQTLLQNADFRRAIEPLNLRYVAFAMVTSRKFMLEGHFQTQIVASAAGQTWRTTSTFSVELLDVKSGRRAGDLWSEKTGDGGFVVGFFFIIPVIVIPWWTRTDSLTCAAIAAELADFVRQKDAVR